ncbi:MAG: hypothetical protein ABR953_08080 [Candidatus Acidiferrales bacterium]
MTVEEVSIPTPGGPVPERLYLPVGVAHSRGTVAVHGIHHLGAYDDLARASRFLATSQEELGERSPMPRTITALRLVHFVGGVLRAAQ